MIHHFPIVNLSMTKCFLLFVRLQIWFILTKMFKNFICWWLHLSVIWKKIITFKIRILITHIFWATFLVKQRYIIMVVMVTKEEKIKNTLYNFYLNILNYLSCSYNWVNINLTKYYYIFLYFTRVITYVVHIIDSFYKNMYF